MSVECNNLAFILQQGFEAKIRWWEARAVGHFIDTDSISFRKSVVPELTIWKSQDLKGSFAEHLWMCRVHAYECTVQGKYFCLIPMNFGQNS